MRRIGPKSFAFNGGLLLALTVTMSFAPNAKACNGVWDLSGQWTLTQSNSFVVTLDVIQTGNQLNGSARFRNDDIDTVYITHFEGEIKNGTSIRFTVPWNQNMVGVYTGAIDDLGRIGGTTYDDQNRGSTAGWSGDHPANCKVAAVTPPSQAPPKKFRRLGKRLPAAGTTPTGQPPPPPAKTATAKEATDVYPTSDGNSEKICTMHVGDKGAFIRSKDGEPDWVLLSNITGECNGIQDWVWNGGSLTIQ